MNISIGVLVFNPKDDPQHLKRICDCINSINNSLSNSGLDGKILIMVNNSMGIGRNTLSMLTNFCFKNEVKMVHIFDNNSFGVMYSRLTKELYYDNSKYIVIYADDYFVPGNYFYNLKFQLGYNMDYTMPRTTFVAQPRLCIPHSYPGEDNVDIKYVDNLYNTWNKQGELETIDSHEYDSTNSFETTVFKREVFEKVGFTDTNYNFIFHNTDFFRRVNKQFRGCIGGFVYHYGKGATKTLYKSGDEKFSGSPVEKELLSDIEYYNKKWNENKRKWWK